MPTLIEAAGLNFVTSRLAVGDIRSRYQPGWRCIVTCCTDSQIREAGFDPELHRFSGHLLRIPFLDGELPDDMAQKIAASREAIGRGIAAGGQVLVHCGAGVSRSVFVLLDYLMASTGMSTTEALAFVRRSHPGAAPAGVYLEFLSRTHRVGEASAFLLPRSS